MNNKINAKEKLLEVKPKIDQEIIRIIETEKNKVKNDSPELAELFENALPNLLQGKRIRGGLVYYSYLGHGGKDEKLALKVAASVELIHSFLLVHDDIIDQDDIRRGIPTLPKIYKDYHSKNNLLRDSHHFGNSIGIIWGDILSFLSLKEINNLDINSEIKTKLFSKLIPQIMVTGYGQFFDVYSENLPEKQVTEADIYKIHQYKTGIYTYENPMQLGAILAGRDSEQEMRAITDVAIPLGIAFQIQDDILGTFGEEKKLGKPSDSDLKEGKKTLLTVYVREHASPEIAEEFSQILGNKNLTKADYLRAQEIIKDSGALEYSRQQVKSRITKAYDAIEKLDWNGPEKDFMIALADYMFNRET